MQWTAFSDLYLVQSSTRAIERSHSVLYSIKTPKVDLCQSVSLWCSLCKSPLNYNCEHVVPAQQRRSCTNYTLSRQMAGSTCKYHEIRRNSEKMCYGRHSGTVISWLPLSKKFLGVIPRSAAFRVIVWIFFLCLCLPRLSQEAKTA